MLKQFVFISLFCLSMAGATHAENITFVWDKNPETDIAGYRLYQSKVSGVYVKGADKAVATTKKGTQKVSIPIEIEGTYYWVVTAYDIRNNESGYSNEVSKTFDWTPPGAPKGLTISITINIQGGE